MLVPMGRFLRATNPMGVLAFPSDERIGLERPYKAQNTFNWTYLLIFHLSYKLELRYVSHILLYYHRSHQAYFLVT